MRSVGGRGGLRVSPWPRFARPSGLAPLPRFARVSPRGLRGRRAAPAVLAPFRGSAPHVAAAALGVFGCCAVFGCILLRFGVDFCALARAIR